MQENVNAPQSAQWTVDPSSLLAKYRTDLDETTYQRLLAEAAVDDLLQRNQALIKRLEEVTAEKNQQRAQFDEELEKVRAELNETLASREEE